MKGKVLKTRRATTAAGEVFEVPTYVVRIDSSTTHGWQVRYGEPSKFFSDEGGAASSLRRAIAELKGRLSKLGLKRRHVAGNYSNKGSDLPLGISGPIVRRRRGGATLEAYLQVVLPVFGKKGKRATVYIGNERTYTVARFRAAVKKAAAMRREAMAVADQQARAAGPAVARLVQARKVHRSR